jgi:DNA-binding NtrC family response regulator
MTTSQFVGSLIGCFPMNDTRSRPANLSPNALRAVEERSFDVYVLDYKMPDGSGLDVAERIRSKWGAGTIILVSGYDTKPIALRAEKLDISDFLEKPFSRESICRVVKTAFDQLPNVAPASEKQPIEEPLRLNFVPRRLAKIKRFWNRPQKVPGLHSRRVYGSSSQLPVRRNFR